MLAFFRHRLCAVSVEKFAEPLFHLNAILSTSLEDRNTGGKEERRNGEGTEMFSMQPIGYVRSPYNDTQEIPKGLGAKQKG